MNPGPRLISAVRDYRSLLDLGYPEQATLKLVGDRYRLDRRERMVLFRGVHGKEFSERISARLLDTLPAGASMAVDGYNVLFTLLNYRRGHPLFIGTDGLLRDAGGAHGRIPADEHFDEASAQLLRSFGTLGAASVSIFLDAPVSGSGDLAAALRSAADGSSCSVVVRTAPSADPFVRDFRGTAAATSDSAVALVSISPPFDLARFILETEFGAAFFRLSDCLAPSSGE